MELNKYLELLQKHRPSDEMLLKSGFTSVPNDIVKNYVLDKKKNIKNYKVNTDAIILQLFNEYDTQYLTFADYNFYKEIKIVKGLSVFAGSSSSELAFEDVELEVIEYDREEWSVLAYCAQNTESFLKALLPLFEMYSFRLQRIIDRKDKAVNDSYLEKCVDAAGGVKYKRFYMDIIG